MKGIIALAFISAGFFANFVFSQNRLPQVKVLNAKYFYYNPEYTTAAAFYLTKANDTYNDLNIFLKLARDFLPESKLNTKVYATDKTFVGGELILDNTTPICQESATRELLPKLFTVDKSLLGTACIKKGVLFLKDMGQFRFEVLVPEIEKKGKYFRADYVVHQGDILHYNMSLYNELV